MQQNPILACRYKGGCFEQTFFHSFRNLYCSNLTCLCCDSAACKSSLSLPQRRFFQCSCHTAQWAILKWPWWMSHGEESECLCWCRLSSPWHLRRVGPVACRLWHMVSPVICGRVEEEGEEDIFCPHGIRWMFSVLPTEHNSVSFFPLWRAVALWGTDFRLHHGALMTGYYCTFLANNQAFFKWNWENRLYHKWSRLGLKIIFLVF